MLKIFECTEDLMVILEPHAHLPCQFSAGSMDGRQFKVVGELEILNIREGKWNIGKGMAHLI